MQTTNREFLEITEDIKNKEYLGNRDVKTVTIKSDYIGDWAFAHCKNLQNVIIVSAHTVIGKDAFLGCDNLVSVKVEKSNNEYLIPLLLRLINKPGMIEMSSTNWYERMDDYISSYLMEPDDKDFEGLWTFGEEDYVEDAFDKDTYIRFIKMDKCQLLLERLNCQNISDSKTKNYVKYLEENMRSGDKKGPVIDILNSKSKRISVYINVLKTCGLINNDNTVSIMKSLDMENAEVMATLLKGMDNEKEEEKSRIDAFFDSL